MIFLIMNIYYTFNLFNFYHAFSLEQWDVIGFKVLFKCLCENVTVHLCPTWATLHTVCVKQVNKKKVRYNTI